MCRASRAEQINQYLYYLPTFQPYMPHASLSLSFPSLLFPTCLSLLAPNCRFSPAGLDTAVISQDAHQAQLVSGRHRSLVTALRRLLPQQHTQSTN
jgi:hypothetical protein